MKRRGFTLIELLVVICIIGLLLLLMLPAVQKTREAAARVQCKNNLHQLGVAMHNFHDSHQRFPSGGWGWNWTAEVDRGCTLSQPAGWIYTLLPYVEQENLYKMGAGQSAAAQHEINVQRTQVPLKLFVCPSRRSASLWPCNTNYTNVDRNPLLAARTDYAALVGYNQFVEWFGPRTLAEGDDPNYDWYDHGNIPPDLWTGVIYRHSSTRIADIRSGTSNVYLVGEKYLNPEDYRSGINVADNESMIVGFDNDIGRCTKWAPRQDTRGYYDFWDFGSAHPGSYNALYCDGSVRMVSYDVDLAIHNNAGKRSP